ncbi:hypothetical protein D9M68_969670 [compost metagenome]
MVYAVAGDLDGRDFDMHAWIGHNLTLSFGAARISLSPAAAAELVAHIQKALIAGGAQ